MCDTTQFDLSIRVNEEVKILGFNGMVMLVFTICATHLDVRYGHIYITFAQAKFEQIHFSFSSFSAGC